MNSLTPPQAAFDEIERLVKKFQALSTRSRNDLNEQATRLQYILPLFRALEWDDGDAQQVYPEEKISRGFVDFSFRINGIRRFVLETKRAGEDLNKPEWAQQAIEYAYHKGVTWATLCDFEALKIFNAEAREANPFQAQFKEFSVEEYLPRLNEVWWLSRSAMIQNVLDREAEKVFKKIPKTPISQALFDNLREWRADLFKLLREYNRGKLYDAKHIDDAVQRILDRLIFIRTAEDRDVEGERLIALVRELQDRKHLNGLVPELNKRFRELDRIYNSQLFSPHYSEDLDLGEPSTLADIIGGLYGSPANSTSYNFALIDADVLGRVYEQYLGTVLSEHEELEAKKTKRKSQGIYYTPTFIVKYIVQQTLGRYLTENGYNPAHPVRVLDPACGSGSFLIEAFDVLDQYLAHERSQERGEYGIHDHARQMQILTENIYGVDKDEQAVEVAQLNLLLKALHVQSKLPKLNHIVQADSLRDDVWEKDLGKITRDGGFDVIIGNPPYVRQEALGDEFKTYAQKKFQTYTGTADLYVYFIEQAHRLLKPNGYFGMICSNKFMRSNYGKALREFLASRTTLLEIVDFGELPVFEDAATFPVILITQNKPTEKQSFVYAPIKRLDFDSLPSEVTTQGHQLDERSLKGGDWTLAQSQELAILEKMRQSSIPLSEYASEDIFFGIKTGINDAFVINRATRTRLIAQDKKSAKLIKPFVVGDDVRKYHINYQDRYLILIPKGWTKSKSKNAKNAWGWLEENYPAIARHLEPFASDAEKRQDKGDYWWELRACDYYEEFEKPKIVYPDIAKESRIAFDTSGLYLANTIYFIPSSDLYLLALLNSKLMFTYFKRNASVLGDPDKGGRLRWFRQDVRKLPIHRINFENAAEKKQHDRVVALVSEMLGLQKEYAEASREKLPLADSLKRRIDEVDAEIDQIVYRLYGLTEEEVKIVEEK